MVMMVVVVVVLFARGDYGAFVELIAESMYEELLVFVLALVVIGVFVVVFFVVGGLSLVNAVFYQFGVVFFGPICDWRDEINKI